MYKLIAQRIREARIMRGLTQEQFAEKCGLSACDISRFENGHTSQPLENILKMCEVLDIGLDQALFDFLPRSVELTDPVSAKILSLLNKMNEIDKRYFLYILKAFINRYTQNS